VPDRRQYKDNPNRFYPDAGIQDGINPHVVVFDELHWQRNRDLQDIFQADEIVVMPSGEVGSIGVFSEQKIDFVGSYYRLFSSEIGFRFCQKIHFDCY
jgi:hypothetical protein